METKWFGRWGVGVEVKRQDCWLGVFWKKTTDTDADNMTEWWVCLVPCVPIHIIRGEWEDA